MRKHGGLVLIVSLLVVLCGCATPPHDGDPWLGHDKAKHFMVAGGIAAASTWAAREAGAEDAEAIVFAVPVTLFAGAAKENYDQRVKGTSWSWRDMTWNLVGALTGSFVVTGVD